MIFKFSQYPKAATRRRFDPENEWKGKNSRRKILQKRWFQASIFVVNSAASLKTLFCHKLVHYGPRENCCTIFFIYKILLVHYHWRLMEWRVYLALRSVERQQNLIKGRGTYAIFITISFALGLHLFICNWEMCNVN